MKHNIYGPVFTESEGIEWDHGPSTLRVRLIPVKNSYTGCVSMELQIWGGEEEGWFEPDWMNREWRNAMQIVLDNLAQSIWDESMGKEVE